jgi:EAL domain-containing protein (putative c-di-GMP-specific phosphodiesterase class I)
MHEARADAARRRRLQRELATAIEEGTLALDFQPRLSLGTGRQTDAEAIIRWPHPRRGQVPQSVFFPLAEATGRSAALGGWMLRAACREAMSWDEPWRVSVRILPSQLDCGLLPGQVADALEASGLNPERLEIELAESTLLDFNLDMLLMLSAIRDLGAGVVLDEFGAGLASLTMLKHLPLTGMKLDRSLVRDLPTDHEDAAIVQAVITAAHALGVWVVAEGIETEPQRAFLSGVGCDGGQGSLFSGPLPAGDLRRRS